MKPLWLDAAARPTRPFLTAPGPSRCSCVRLLAPAAARWVTMDDTPAEYGAPVYLKGSHKNKSVKNDAVFVNLAEGDLKVT